VISATGFIVLKLIVWKLSGSVSVLAEAIHSTADLVGSTLALVSIRLADTPPDETHTYGHGKFENVSGMFIALFILGAGALTINEAIQHLHSSRHIDYAIPAVGVMALSAIANVFISRNLLKVGRETDSPALEADGHHLQTDIFTALGVVIALTVIITTHGRLTWVDPLGAFIVSGLVFWLGLRVARESLITLSDAALPETEEKQLRAVLDCDKRILGYHKLRTRKSGSHRHVDVHVQLSDTLTFVEAHHLTEEIEDHLREALPNVHVMIHIEPFVDELHHQQTYHADDPPRA